MGSIAEIKQRETTDTPLVLFECQGMDGEVRRWSTHTLSWEGQTYEARVIQHNAFEMRASPEEAIDGAARLSLQLANADGYCSEQEQNFGWKGARLTARFLFLDAQSGAATSESRIIFRGVASSPEETTESAMRLNFSNRLLLQRLQLPEVRIQKRCPWAFPTSAAQRAEAREGGVEAKYSSLYRCGYSADLENGAGNLNGEAPYTSCRFTRADCEARGMFSADALQRPTRRFGGVEYVPSTITVRSYGEKGTHSSAPVSNAASYNDSVPLIYGTAWYNPPVVFGRNDGNLTHLEVLLGMGEIEGVVKVLVNEIEIPRGVAGANMTATGWYNLPTTGTRNGGFNNSFLDGRGNPAGDPYGSMAVTSIVVPNRIHDGKSVPNVRVLVQGMKLSRYDEQGQSIGESFTNNPAWVLLDLLRRSGWVESELDLTSFARTAAYCGESIESSDLNGNVRQIPRFQCNLVLQKRRSAADVIRGVRNGSGLYLAHTADARLQLQAEQTLAQQQPTLPAGSNSQLPLAGGWPAYEFGDGSDGTSDILVRRDGTPAFRLWSRDASDTPNRYSIEFQDEMNEYQQDSLSLVDLEDARRSGQQAGASLTALGIPNFNQAARVARLALDRAIRGNVFVEFETGVRGVMLRPGDLITITYRRHGLTRQLFRITKIVPGLNYRSSRITAQIHDDGWYGGATGLDGSGPGRQPGVAPAVPRPLHGAALDLEGHRTYEFAERSSATADGGRDVTLRVGFLSPARPAQGMRGVPLIDLTAQVENSGGTLAGNQNLYYGITALDAQQQESALSFLALAVLPESTNANRVVLRGISLPRGATAFHVYRGPSPMQLSRIATAQDPAVEFVDAGSGEGEEGPPDASYDHARAYWRLEVLSPVAVQMHSATTAGNATLSMIADEHAGRTLRIMNGRGEGQERRIASNSATVLTVDPAWTIEPDGSSTISIVEPNWHDGAAGTGSPLEFSIPNRAGVFVQVQVRAVNVLGIECPGELSLVGRWRIQGADSGGVVGDTEVPPVPVFGLTAVGNGELEIAGIGFESFENTRTITSATAALDAVDELATAVAHVAEDWDPVSTTLALNGEFQPGDRLQIDREIVEVVQAAGGAVEVRRGAAGSGAAEHAQGTPIWRLVRRTAVLAFPREFFGSPASGSYAYRMHWPCVRVSAASLTATNAQGSGGAGTTCYTGLGDGGLRTFSGGQLSLQIEGTMAVQEDAVPPLTVDRSRSVRDVTARVRTAPTGDALVLRLKQDQEVYCELTIAAENTESESMNGVTLPPLVAGSVLSLDIVAVPTNASDEPGRDLTVTIRS